MRKRTTQVQAKMREVFEIHWVTGTVKYLQKLPKTGDSLHTFFSRSDDLVQTNKQYLYK